MLRSSESVGWLIEEAIVLIICKDDAFEDKSVASESDLAATLLKFLSTIS